jgi:hypothetical protein
MSYSSSSQKSREKSHYYKLTDDRQSMEMLEARVMLSSPPTDVIDLDLTNVNEVSGSADTVYRFQLEAGQRYLFMEDYSSKISLLDSDGNEIEVAPTNYIEPTPGESGTYFLRVQFHSQQPFHLLAKPILDDFGDSIYDAATLGKDQIISGNMDDPEDRDFFRFQGVKGERWAVDVLARSWINVHFADDRGEPLICSDGCEPLPYSGDYFISLDATGRVQPYTLQARRVVDDNAGTVEGASPLTIGADAAGRLDFTRDEDWFAFTAKAGTTYAFVARTGVYPIFELRIYNAEGKQMEEGGFPSGRLDSLRLEWVAPADGKYYLGIRSVGVRTNYTISSVVQEVQDASAAGVARPISFGTKIDGGVDGAGGSQYFSFSAVKNATYRIRTESGQIPQSIVMGIIGPDGRSVIARDALNSWPWTAAETGTYYLWVRSYDASPSGKFTFGIDQELDDYGNNAAEAAPITPGVKVQGLPQYYLDEDWFRVDVTAGKKYVFSLERGTKQTVQPYFRLRRSQMHFVLLSLIDSEGRELAIDGRELASGEEASAKPARVEWTAKQSGVVFVRLSPMHYGMPYALMVTEAEDKPQAARPGAGKKCPAVNGARHKVKQLPGCNLVSRAHHRQKHHRRGAAGGRDLSKPQAQHAGAAFVR